MTRPKYPSISIGMPDELAERLQCAADERMVSRSLLGEALIREGLERLIPPNEVRWTRGALVSPAVLRCHLCGHEEHDDRGQCSAYMPGDAASGEFECQCGAPKMEIRPLRESSGYETRASHSEGESNGGVRA